MNNFTSLFCLLFLTLSLQAQVSKTINISAGGLSSALSESEKSTITNLTISGTIDARDFLVMRESMAVLSVLNISSASVSGYVGTLGSPGSIQAYPANTIPESAFNSKVKLKSIVLPNNLTSIGAQAFMGCKGLTSVTVPSSLNSIKISAFNGCSSLNTLTIPSSVTLIEGYCFSWCPAAITVSASNPNYSSVDGVLFDKEKTVLIHCPASKYGIYTIPETVVTISPDAFLNCMSLSAVVIPSTVTSIGRGAFYQCMQLTSIVLPPNLTSIEEETFNNCRNLISVVLPSTVTTIKKAAFINCVELASISFPSTLTSIGDNAFDNCSNLTSITIPSTIQTINKQAFRYCTKLTSINVDSPNPIDLSLSPEVFYNVDNTSCTLYVPYMTKDIYAAANQWGDFSTIVDRSGFYLSSSRADVFAEEGNRDSIVIFADVPWTISSIPSWLTVFPENGTGNDTLVFTANANTEYTDRRANLTVSATGIPSQTIEFIQWGLPKTVTVTAGNLSQEISSLEKNSISNLKLIGTINACDFKTMRDSMPVLSVVDLSEVSIVQYSGTMGTSGINSFYSANSIPEYAFCTPGTLTGKNSLHRIIPPSNITLIGKYAFYGCRNIKNFTMSPLVSQIENFAFNGCSNLTSFVTNSTLTSLGAYSFSGCKNLVSFQFPTSLESIGGNAFENCIKLTSIEIPASITSMGSAVFKGCSGLQSATVNASIPELGMKLFYGCSKLTSFAIPPTVKSIGENAFGYCSNLNTISIPSTATSIKQEAFSYCINLQNVTLPESLTYIGTYAFEMCTSLLSLTIPPKVTAINDYTFYQCQNLASITIPPSVKTIGEYAFYECSSLTSVEIPSSVTSIERSAFSSCYELSTINLPSSVKSIGVGAFSENWSLTSVTIPESMTKIEHLTFFRCGLTAITIPETITSIGNNAFSNCTDIDSIKVESSVPIDLTNSIDVFDRVDKSTCKLYVPYGSSALYKTADQWEDFIQIIEYDFYVEFPEVRLNAEEGSQARLWLSAHTEWTASSDQPWLTVSPSTGSGEDSLIFTAQANDTNIERMATVTVSTIGETPITIQVIQKLSSLNEFKAQAISTHQVDVEWIRNLSNDSVLVAFSNTDSFGEPVDGDIYEPGDVLPGGGVILYFGSGTNCIHSGLTPGAKYYYKAWSYRPAFYSGSKVCTTLTHLNFPYIQEFSIGELPAGWSVADNIGNNEIWVFTDLEKYDFNSTTSENGFATISSYEYGVGSGQNTELISPIFDISAIADSSIIISFEHEYYEEDYGNSVSFYYSLDAGKTWITSKDWDSSTSSVELFSTTFSTQLYGHSQIMFKWSYTGNYPESWAIDDIQLFTYDCTPVINFPYTQDFSAPHLPFCWTIDDHVGNNQIWTFNNPRNRIISTSTSENGFAIIDSDNYGSGGIQNCDLISPVFDFSQLNAPEKISLEFSHVFSFYEPSIATLSYSTDNGTSWDTLQTWGKDTQNPEQYTIDLTRELANQSQVQFKWNYCGEFAWYWAIDDITVSAEEGGLVPRILAVSDTTLHESNIACFNALDTVIVAGDETNVILESASSVEIIAGKTIRFMPGFHAREGSNLFGHITTNNTFCLYEKSPGIEHFETEKSEPISITADTSTIITITQKQAKIYPNPNNGQFIVDMNQFEGISKIMITTTSGVVVYKAQTEDKTIQIELNHLSKGLYFVNIENRKYHQCNKIIIQ